MNPLEIAQGWLTDRNIEYMVDTCNLREGISGLYPQGRTEIKRREDVLGGVYVTARYTFLVKIPAVPSRSMEIWLQGLQRTVPPNLEADVRFAVQDGKLKKQTGDGLAWYELRLIVEREEENA